MPLRFAQAKELHPDPRVRKVVCYRITVHPANGTVEYEFVAEDEHDKPVGNLRTSSDDLPKQVMSGLLRHAYQTVQAKLGDGAVDDDP